MSDSKNKKAIYGGLAPSVGAEWRLVNDGDVYLESPHIPRKCPFNAVLMKPLLKRKGRLLIAGILGVILGFTGIHFFLMRHTKKGLVRLGSFLAVGLLGWASFRYLEVAGIAFAVVAVCAMLALTLFIFGFEEGVFLCNLAAYDARMATKRGISRFLSFRIGRLTIEAIIEILLVIAFIVVAVWLYIIYH